MFLGAMMVRVASLVSQSRFACRRVFTGCTSPVKSNNAAAETVSNFADSNISHTHFDQYTSMSAEEPPIVVILWFPRIYLIKARILECPFSIKGDLKSTLSEICIPRPSFSLLERCSLTAIVSKGIG